ncbi:1521_t:CDS:2, partial [Cetraspora pellucida]
WKIGSFTGIEKWGRWNFYNRSFTGARKKADNTSTIYVHM